MTDKKRKDALPVLSQPLPSSAKRNTYLKTLQSKGLNAISALGTRGIRSSYERRRSELLAAGGVQGTLPGFEDKIAAEVYVEKSDVTYVINHPMSHSFTGRTEQVLWFLVQRFTESVKPWNKSPADIAKCRRIMLDLHEMRAAFGLKDAKTAKETLENALWTLLDTEIRWTERTYQKIEGSSGKGKPVGTLKWKANIISAIGVGEMLVQPKEVNKDKKGLQNPVAFRRGFLVVELSEALVGNLVANNFTMYFPEKVFLINPLYYRNSVSMSFKLADHYNQNIGKRNQHTISVVSLMENAPDLPSYTEVMNTKGKHVYQQILRPFIRDLLYLKEFGILKECYFFKEPKKPIPEAELKSFKYDDFRTLKVHFEFLQHPGRTKNNIDDSLLPPGTETAVEG